MRSLFRRFLSAYPEAWSIPRSFRLIRFALINLHPHYIADLKRTEL